LAMGIKSLMKISFETFLSLSIYARPHYRKGLSSGLISIQILLSN
jgi:hypothetical protein